ILIQEFICPDSFQFSIPQLSCGDFFNSIGQSRTSADLCHTTASAPIVLQNYFEHPSAKDRFKIALSTATQFQKRVHPDSIISNSNSTDLDWRLFATQSPRKRT